jgi:hypothetical protein
MEKERQTRVARYRNMAGNFQAGTVRKDTGRILLS